MPMICENWLGLVNSGITIPAEPMKFTNTTLLDFKAPFIE